MRSTCSLNQDITHDEDPSAPGYTPQGADAAQRSNVLGDGDVNFPDGRAIETWLTGPFHAIGMLDPVLASVGFGSARDAAAGASPTPRQPGRTWVSRPHRTPACSRSCSPGTGRRCP